MNDPGFGWHDFEVLERLLPPAQKAIPFLVATVLHVGVVLEGQLRAEVVHLHRMIDDQLDGLERVDPLRVAAHPLHGVAHGSQVHDGGDAGKILE